MSFYISAIIPSFNRYEFLLNAVNSVKNQSIENYEIIIINDGSTDSNYYTNSFNDSNIKQIDLKENQKIKNGFSSDAIRNIGISEAKGKYVAFLDDDDVWFPDKLEIQVNLLEESTNKLSCTEGYFGLGKYDLKKKYKLYNQDHYYKEISKKYKGSEFIKNENLMKKFKFPKEFTSDFIDIHNCIVTSSLIVETDLIKKVGMFDPALPNGVGDYDCWKKMLQFTNCEYTEKPLFYYDGFHGTGQNYK